MTFNYKGINANYNGEQLTYSLCLDTLEHAIGTAPKLTVSYDFDGDGEWDRVETAGYFALDPIDNTWECFTQESVALHASGEEYQDFENGSIQFAIWEATGNKGATKLQGNRSFIELPYGEKQLDEDESERETTAAVIESDTASATNLYLSQNGSLSLTSGSNEQGVTIVGKSDNAITFDYQGITADYIDGDLSYNICLDTISQTVGTAPKFSVSYDFDGDGKWDRVESAGYFALDPTDDNWECFTELRAGVTVTGDDYQTFENGTIQVSIWEVLGDVGSTEVKVNTAEQASLINVPYGL